MNNNKLFNELQVKLAQEIYNKYDKVINKVAKLHKISKQAILDKITEASSKQEELKPELTKSMEDSGLKNIADDMFEVTFVAATTRENFDKKGFEKKYPVIYKQFLQKSEVSAYVKISNNNK